MKFRVAVIDGSNMLGRYAHALLGAKVDEGALIDRQFVATCLVSVDEAIRRFAAETQCTHVIVALDAWPSWRRLLSADYKADRQAGSALSDWFATQQVELANPEIRADIGNPLVTASAAGFESGDVVATLVQRLIEKGRRAVTLSGNVNLLQLLPAGAECWMFGGKGEPKFVQRTARWACELFEIARIEHFTAYRALVGGDRIPGVQGIGPKKARAILAALDTEEHIITSGMVPVDMFRLMLTLVTLRTDAPVPPIDPKVCEL